MGLNEFFENLVEEEDPKLMGVLQKLYGPFVQLSLLFPSYKPENIKLTLFTIFFSSLFILFHYYLMITTIFKSLESTELASLCFNYLMIFTFVIITLPLLAYHRSIMANMHRNLLDNLGEYEAIDLYMDKKPQKFEEKRKKEFLQFLALPGLVVVMVTVVLMVPYLKKFNNPPQYEHGVNLNVPIPLWYPFPTHEGLLHVAAVAGQLTAGGNLALTVCTMEVMLFRVAQAIIFEYQVLRYALETMLRRARIICLKRYPHLGGSKVHYKNPEFQLCLTDRLKECVKHHHKIRQRLSAFEDILKWPGALAYGFGTGTIGLALVNMLIGMKTENYENIAVFGLLASTGVLNMFMLSVIGESITTETKTLRDHLYYIDWYKLNVRNRRMMLNFQIGVNNPVIVYAGGVVAMCMDTFSSIMNNAYSFFNLMNADVGSKDK